MHHKPILDFVCTAFAAFGISLGIIPPVSIAANTPPVFLSGPRLEPRPEAPMRCFVVEDGRPVALDNSPGAPLLADQNSQASKELLAARQIRRQRLIEADEFESRCREKRLTEDQVYGLLRGYVWREKAPPIGKHGYFLPNFYDPASLINFTPNRFQYRSSRAQDSGSWSFYQTTEGGGYITTSNSVQRFAFLEDGSLSLAGHLFGPYGPPKDWSDKGSLRPRPLPPQIAFVDVLTSGTWQRANDFDLQDSLQFFADGHLITKAKGRLPETKFWSFLPGANAPIAHGYATAAAYSFANRWVKPSSIKVVSARLIAINDATFVRGAADEQEGVIVGASNNMNLLVTYDRPIIDGKATVFHLNVTNPTSKKYGLLDLSIERCRWQFEQSTQDYRAADQLREDSYGRGQLSFIPGKTKRIDIPIMLNSKHPASVRINLQGTEKGRACGFAFFYGSGSIRDRQQIF
jgi:hypothetical protein